jgi:hypothetical protein
MWYLLFILLALKLARCESFTSKWAPRVSQRMNLEAKNFGKQLASFFLAASVPLASLAPLSAQAFGPTEVVLSDLSYKQVELCNGQKPIMPGQKAMEGLYPTCIEVEAEATNPSGKLLKDVAVYGFIKEKDAGNSVLPNNPDFRSDAGQYAMINQVPPGGGKVKFQFVAATVANTAKGDTLPGLIFFNTKAVAYPGGNKFKALDPCEIDPRADGCNADVYGDDD